MNEQNDEFIMKQKQVQYEQQQPINRKLHSIFGFEIKPNWSIQKQLVISLLIFSSIVFAIVITLVFLGIHISRTMILDSATGSLQQQIYQNFIDQANVFSMTTMKLLNNQAGNLDICNKIILAAMKQDSSLFDFNLQNAFPVYGPNYNLTVFQQIPQILVTQQQSLIQHYGQNITLDTWTWGAFNSNNKTSLSSYGQLIYNSTDVLNLFLSEIFFNQNITYINLIYFVFYQDGFSAFFPGGAKILSEEDSYNPTQTHWFNNSINQVQNQKQQAQNNSDYNYDPVVSIQYEKNQSYKIISVSLPIINDEDEIIGVSNIDMTQDSIEQLFSFIGPYNQSQIVYFINSQGQIMNDPLSINIPYTLNYTNITNITNNSWSQINSWAQNQAQNTQKVLCDEIFFETNSNDESILLIVSQNIQPSGRSYIIVVTYLLQSVAYQPITTLSQEMINEFNKIQDESIIMIVTTCSLSIIIAYICSYYIVKPLSLLTQYAVQINSSIKSNRTGEYTKEIKKINLEKINAGDKIGELLEAFKNLIQGLAGLKKTNNSNKNKASNHQQISYPLNSNTDIKLPWEDLIDQIQDFDELQTNE